ncbi:uncharacterized protein LOC107210104 isoform X1 [Parus major]|uniref:uncharacterized protein LOC107210104 isoform X1 n=1 Tax=Parus major TaxID=9157 RepID=UPI0014442C4C|nr:uncharacterized protein LOC107210104 isoform X1 [Parus major]
MSPGPQPALAPNWAELALAPDRAWLCPLGLGELSQSREGQGWQWLLRDGFGLSPWKEPLPKQLCCPWALLLAFWALLGGTACAKGQQGACRPQLWGKQRTSRPYPACCQLSSGAQHGLTLHIASVDGAGTTSHVPDSRKGTETGFCQGTLCWLEITAMVAGGELVIMLCCFGICYACKRKRHLLEEKLKAGGWSQDLYSPKSYSSSSDTDEFIFAPSSFVML